MTHAEFPNTQARPLPALSATCFLVFYLGVMVWGGLYLRDPRIRRLLAFGND